MSELQKIDGELGLGYKEACDYLQKAILLTLASTDQDGRLCDTAFINAMLLLLTDPPRWPHPPRNAVQDRSERHYRPGFGNTLINITLSATDAKLRRLKQQVSTCRCNTYKSAYGGHGFAVLHKDLHVKTLSGDFQLLLCKMLYLFITRMLRLPSLANAFHSKILVPDANYTIPDEVMEGVQYIVNRPTDVISASRCWFKHTRCPFVLFFAIMCIRLFASAFVPVLRSASGQDLLNLVIKETQRLTSGIQQKSSGLDEGLADAVMACIQYIREIMQRFRIPFQRTEKPLLEVIHKTTMTLLDTFDALKLSEQKMFIDRNIVGSISYLGIGSTPAGEDDQDKRQKLVYYFTRYDDLGRSTFSAALNVLEVRDQPREIYCRVYSDIQTLRPVQECLNPRCGKIPDHHRYPRCSRCGIVSYCSPNCQKQAWNLPECPHQKVCKDWSRLEACWPNVLELLNAGMDWAQQDALLRKSAIPLGIPESRLIEMIENAKMLQDIRAKRAKDNNETKKGEADRLLMDEIESCVPGLRHTLGLY